MRDARFPIGRRQPPIYCSVFDPPDNDRVDNHLMETILQFR